MKARHRLSLLDRLRGWHWQDRWYVHHGDVVGVSLVKVRNWCGCEIRSPGLECTG